VVLAKVKRGNGYELVMAFRGTETTWNKGFVSDGLTDAKISKRSVTNIKGLEKRKDLADCSVSGKVWDICIIPTLLCSVPHDNSLKSSCLRHLLGAG
jgi:hypothetical protein